MTLPGNKKLVCVGSYRLTGHRLGRGNFARVEEALHTVLKTKVSIVCLLCLFHLCLQSATIKRCTNHRTRQIENLSIRELVRNRFWTLGPFSSGTLRKRQRPVTERYKN